MLILGKSLAVVVWGALAAIVVLADVSVVEAAAVAAVASVANTWLLLRHDSRLQQLRDELRRAHRDLTSRRTSTRAGDRDVVVIDTEQMENVARELQNGGGDREQH